VVEVGRLGVLVSWSQADRLGVVQVRARNADESWPASELRDEAEADEKILAGGPQVELVDDSFPLRSVDVAEGKRPLDCQSKSRALTTLFSRGRSNRRRDRIDNASSSACGVDGEGAQVASHLETSELKDGAQLSVAGLLHGVHLV